MRGNDLKKFEFTLDKLKNYREQLLDREKNSLSFINNQRAKLLEDKRNVEAELRHSTLEFRERAKIGVNIMQMNVFKSYQHSLNMKIKDIDEAITDVSLRIERQLQRVIAATKDVSSLEKLEEKQLDAYKADLQKADENFIAEYVNNIAIRKMYSQRTGV
jgi:flagellar FliJ protein